MRTVFAAVALVAFALGLFEGSTRARAAESKPRASPTPTATATPSPAPADTPTPEASPKTTPTPQATATVAAPPTPPTMSDVLGDPDVRSLVRRPIRQLADVAWMTGTWHAKAKTYVFAFTMKGRWLFGADGSAADYFYLTYDPLSERWILVRLEGFPSYGLWTSNSGWSDNRIVFTSSIAYVGGRPFHRRFTIVRRDKRHMTLVGEEQRADDSWLTDDTTELAKQ